MIGVYIVGEDDVTRHVIYRILSYCGAGRFTVLMELPARGGEIKNKIPNFNQLAMKFPVILLTDLDADNCAPYIEPMSHQSWKYSLCSRYSGRNSLYNS